MSMVGTGLRKVTSLARRNRRRVDLSHPARSPLGSSAVNCVLYRDGIRQPAAATVEEAVRKVRNGPYLHLSSTTAGHSFEARAGT